MVTIAEYQTNEKKFATCIEEIGKRCATSLEYLANIPRESWTRANDRGYRHGFMKTNLSESYNAIIKGVRSLLVLALLRKIFYNCVGYFQHAKMASNVICKGIAYIEEAFKSIEKWIEKATRHKVKNFSRSMGIYEMETGSYMTEHGKKGGYKYTIDIISRTCTCKK